MATHPPSTSSLAFNLSLSLNKFGPRLGSIHLCRNNPSDATIETQIRLPTPTFITSSSRGVIPHLSGDNIRRTPAVRWVNVPFESFLEHNPPVPTLYPFKDPLHAFLGFDPGKKIVSLSARDPDDCREMPPNGNAAVSVWTLRGVRKLSPSDWRTYTLKCQPDFVFSLSDTPFTDPIHHAYSQKRLTKSIERTAAWLGVMLRPWSGQNENEKSTQKKKRGNKPKTIPNTASNLQLLSKDSTANSTPGRVETLLPPLPLPPIFLPMAGGSSIAARRAFASSLLEPFYGPEAESMKHRGINNLDEGVTGYSFDLTTLKGRGGNPLREDEVVDFEKGGDDKIEPPTSIPPSSALSSDLISLIQASLAPLTDSKLRLINSTEGPHEILRYITHVGVDVFDAAWAQRLAGWGVGLDFEFPVKANQRERGRSLGHNLYDATYAFDFGTIADCYRGDFGGSEGDNRPICACAACSPLSPLDRDQMRHGVDSAEHTLVSQQSTPTMQKHHTRAYIHHLLRTHEMGAHVLLAMHNLSVLDKFFDGVREIMASLASASGEDDERMRRWTEEVDRFCRTYDEAKSQEVFGCAGRDWKDVDHARGKGRLARERQIQEEGIPN